MLTELIALFAGSPVLFSGAVFVVGLMVGSFLNVVIYRLPLILERQWRSQAAEWSPSMDGVAVEIDGFSGEIQRTQAERNAAAESSGARAAPGPGRAEPFTLSTPRSACPACKSPIKPWHNVPVAGWLLLRGRCAACDARISVRYPVVELATALLSGWVAWHFGAGMVCACALLVTWALIALTGIDIDHQLLPDSITLPLLWAGLLAAVAVGPVAGSPLPVAAPDAIIGAAAGYASLWLVFHVFRLVTGKEGMGYGDFKLFAALGAWVGWRMLPLVILLSAGTGAVIGILMIVVQGRDRRAPMPFGPYLAAAGWLALMYGNSLISGYLRLSGLQR